MLVQMLPISHEIGVKRSHKMAPTRTYEKGGWQGIRQCLESEGELSKGGRIEFEKSFHRTVHSKVVSKEWNEPEQPFSLRSLCGLKRPSVEVCVDWDTHVWSVV